MKLCVLVVALCLLLLQSKAFVTSRGLSSNQHLSRSYHPIAPVPNPADRNVQVVANMQASSKSASINKAAVKAISKLIGTCGIGVWAGKAGILDQNALGVLSRLIFSLFQPCLLFVNVATTVASSGSGSGGASLYMLPLVAGFQILLGYVIGKLVSSVVYRSNPNSEEAKQLMACTTFSNSGPLPLVFADGLFRTHANKALAANSIAYISLYLLGWSPLFWIVAPAILKDAEVPGEGTAVSAAERRKALLQRIFSPPVVGAILGLLVGAVPFLRKVFISSEGLFNPLFESMRTIGTAYLPTVLVVLAGSLSASGAAKAKAGGDNSKATADSAAAAVVERANTSQAFALQVVCIYIARFLLMPSAAFALVGLVAKYLPAVHRIFQKDPLLLLVLLLESCMPSAQNTTVIYQLQGKKDAAGRLARVLMVLYVLGIPAMSYWLIKILNLTGLAG